jgi:hypothetical protein
VFTQVSRMHLTPAVAGRGVRPAKLHNLSELESGAAAPDGRSLLRKSVAKKSEPAVTVATTLTCHSLVRRKQGDIASVAA